MSRRFRRPWPLLLLVTLLAACQPGEPPTATLSVEGPEVQVNGLPARDGMTVRQGDQISTGERSAASIGWEDGTTVRLDQNSDPVVTWDGRILVVSVGYGWFLIDTGRMEVRIVNELAEVVAKSRVCVNVRPGERFDVWVLEGEVDPVRPAGFDVAADETASIQPAGITTDPITAAERADIEQRFAPGRFADGTPR
jgi:hypothetical protein